MLPGRLCRVRTWASCTRNPNGEGPRSSRSRCRTPHRFPPPNGRPPWPRGTGWFVYSSNTNISFFHSADEFEIVRLSSKLFVSKERNSRWYLLGFRKNSSQAALNSANVSKYWLYKVFFLKNFQKRSIKFRFGA